LRILCIILCFILFPVGNLHAVVRIGIADVPPYNYFDENGQAQGFFPELFDSIARDHHWEIEYISCPWAECLAQLTRNEIDILTDIAYSRERATGYNFSSETIVNSYGQIYHRGDLSLTSLPDLNGKRVAVVTDDIYFAGPEGLAQLAADNNIRPTYLMADSYPEAFALVKGGSADAALVDHFFGNASGTDLIRSTLSLKPTQIQPAFSLASDPQLRESFDQTIKALKKDPFSEFHQLSRKWLTVSSAPDMPTWMVPLFVVLLASLLVLLLTVHIIRRQVRSKTLELAKKNRQLGQELSERRRIEAELSERQQQYQVLFEDSLTNMLLIDPYSGRIVDANPAACDFYQLSRDAIKLLHIWDIDQADKDAALQQLKEMTNLSTRQCEFTHRLADGQLRQVEIFSSPFAIEGRALTCFIIHNISARKIAEQNLKEQNIFLQTVIDGVPDPLTVFNLEGNILQTNQASRVHFNQQFHLDVKQSETFQHPHLDELLIAFEEIKKNRRQTVKIHTREKDGEKRFIEISASPLFDSTGQLYAIVEVLRDITERMQIKEILNENEKRLHHLAHHDSLTNLPNRLLFEDRLKQAINKSRRSRHQVALFFLDLDHFKEINDNLGHEYGDRLLQDVAKRLNSCVREADTVARMGGDEFLVLLEDIGSIELIEATAQRICNALNHSLSEGDYSQKISSSIGIAIFPEDAADAQGLLKAADQAMYRAKKNGKANYQFFNAPQGQFLF
jgi:diguanylate cyclase (GGDEF)-like protein/PAS domain S-box-containing protein